MHQNIWSQNDSLHRSLQSSFKQLDEKMDSIDAAMKKFGDRVPDTPGPSPNEDPGELAKQVTAYIEELEASLKEIEGTSSPISSPYALLYVRSHKAHRALKLDTLGPLHCNTSLLLFHKSAIYMICSGFR